MQDELTTVLGIKLSPDALQKLDKFKQGLQSVADKFAAVGKASVATGAALLTVMKLAGDGANQLKQLSDSTGIATSELQALEYASKSTGVSFDAVKGDIQSLTKELNNPLPGQFNEGLVLLGVSTRDSSGKVKKATDVFNDLADKLKNMSAQKAIAWGQKIGISEDTVKLLRQGKAGLDALKAEGKAVGAIVPDSAVNGLAEFSKGMNQLAMIGKSLANTFLGMLAPALNKIIDGYKKWSASNGDIIRSGIEFIAKQIGIAFTMVSNVLGKVFQSTSGVFKIFKPFIDILKKSNVVAGALTAAMGALAIGGIMKVISMIRMLNPWMLAIAVIVEELYAWFTKGFESTGFFKLWTVFEKKFPAVAGVLRDCFRGLKEIWDACTDTVMGLWEAAKPCFDTLIESVMALWDICKPFIAWWGEIYAKVIGEWFGGIKKAVIALFNFLKKYFQFMFNLWNNTVGKVLKGAVGFFKKLTGKGKEEPVEQGEGASSGAITENPIKGEMVNAALYTSQNVPTGQTVNNNNNTTNNNQKVNGTTNVYIQAGNSSPNEILGAVKQQYGNSTNITSPMASTGGAVVQ